MIGKRIKQLRKERNLTQDELAKHLGISRQAICMWEADKRELRVSTLHRVVKLLGVSIDELMRFEQSAVQKRRGEMVKKVKQKTAKTCFELAAPQAKKVVVTGSFNSWQEKGIGMKKSKDGVWKTTVDLELGRYEYKFIVDGRWMNDPTNNKTSGNAFGTFNSVREVSV